MRCVFSMDRLFHGRTLAWTLLGAMACALLLSGSALAKPSTGTQKIVKDGKTLDQDGLVLENQYLKAVIADNKYAGQIMELIYKPTGQNLAPIKENQGYSTDRMGEDRYYWTERHSSDYQGKILGVEDGTARARISYVWHYDYNDTQSTVNVSKAYALPKGSATLFVTWTLKNVGDKEVQMSPWVKHVGGASKERLGGPRRMVTEHGPADPGGAFVKPTTNWIARLSEAKNTTAKPMMVSLMDFKDIFQQFQWGGRDRYTLETILKRIHLKPGESWKITYALSPMANLGDLAWASPELGASVKVEGDQKLKVGREATLQVFVAGAMNLGERRLEGVILDADNKTIQKLPNRQVSVVPGTIDSTTYKFTPPADGVYHLSLTVYDDSQKIIKLGEKVNSQQSSITLPVVVGPVTPKMVVVEPWKSSGVSWPTRKPRQVAPWRTVLNTPAIKAGQILTPERIFPEDKLVASEKTQPAAVRLAKGEYEDIELAVQRTDGGDVMALRLSLSPLTNDAGKTLDKPQAREQFYLTTSVPSGYRAFPVGQYPDPLFLAGWQDKLDPNAAPTKINLKAKRESNRRVFWIVVKAPRDAAAGTYRGKVTISDAGKTLGTIPIAVRVNDFALPKHPTYACSTGMVSFGGRSEWTSSMRDLGMSDAAIEAGRGRFKTGTDLVNLCQQLMFRYGWTPTMWFGSLDQFKRYENYGRGISVYSCGSAGGKVEQWLKDNGLLKYAFVYAPFDEHPNSVVPKVVEWCKKWKAKSDIPIFDCYYGNRVEPLFGLVDIWAQNPQQDWAKKRAKKGDRFWGINSAMIWFVETPPISGRRQAWSDFSTGYDGRYVYSTTRWTKKTYTKNWTSGNYMGCLIYPAPQGVSTSIRMENLRDSVDDYDYLSMLRDAVEAATKAGVKSDALTEAGKIVTDEHLGDRVRSVEELHAMRGKIADLIEKLQ